MNIQDQILVIFLSYVIAFFYIRGFLYGVKRYQLNNSAYKKRKKEEGFKEWLFYLKYKDEIPKVLRIFYYIVLLLHPIGMVFCFLLSVCNDKLLQIGIIIAHAIFAFDAIWFLVIALLFWSPGPGYKYERWIKKKRGEKR